MGPRLSVTLRVSFETGNRKRHFAATGGKWIYSNAACSGIIDADRSMSGIDNATQSLYGAE